MSRNVKCLKMSNVLKCQMSQNVNVPKCQCPEMSNVTKCHKNVKCQINVTKRQMSRNVKCKEMSNVMKCQMSFAVAPGYSQ